MKFKKGDKVIFYRDTTVLKLRAPYLGKILTIKSVSKFSTGELVYYDVEETDSYFREDWLELVEIYNSPLAKAMREDEELTHCVTDIKNNTI